MTFFPHDTIRPIQQKMIDAVTAALAESKPLVVHAPTGLGKTAASLAPALEYSMKHDKIVFFLTSRHTQHRIAIDTLRAIKEKSMADFAVADIIGKRHMCAQPNIEMLGSKDFSEYCKKVREEGTCEFYNNTKNKALKATQHAQAVIRRLKISPQQVDGLVGIAKTERTCPYEIATLLAKESRVVVCDYNYLFSQTIRDSFLRRLERNLSDCIIVVDEAHNLPDRIREMLSEQLSLFVIERAIKEATKFEFPTIVQYLERIHGILEDLGKNLGQNGEQKVSRLAFYDAVNSIGDYDEIRSQLILCGDDIREKQRASFVGAAGTFLASWVGPEEGYVRMVTTSGGRLRLVYRCLDPSVAAAPVVSEAHSVICMSGTLTPTAMYKDLLGMSEASEETFPSPFPEENKLTLIVPSTTTKYSARSEDQYKAIATEIVSLCSKIPGNIAVFFPSYYLRDQVYPYLYDKISKTVFQEDSSMTKHQKQDMLEKFKSYKNTGAVLLGVVAANFSEGIDFPGDLLRGVIVVGLPLSRPDLETQELIGYYDKLFGKGWDYGYVFPAFNKTLQAAGRCIRSETDRGAIVFLDERYAWPNYIRCFPEDVNLKVTKKYTDLIEGFFDNQS